MHLPRRPCCKHVRLRRKRAAGIAGWIMPGALLVLMPKCPACLAAYIAMASGIGLSLTAAAYLRIALVLLCVGSLGFAGFLKLRKFLQNG